MAGGLSTIKYKCIGEPAPMNFNVSSTPLHKAPTTHTLCLFALSPLPFYLISLILPQRQQDEKKEEKRQKERENRFGAEEANLTEESGTSQRLKYHK